MAKTNFERFGIYQSRKNITSGHHQLFLNQYENRVHTLGLTTKPFVLFKTIKINGLGSGLDKEIYMLPFVYDLPSNSLGKQVGSLSGRLAKKDLTNIAMCESGGHKGSDK